MSDEIYKIIANYQKFQSEIMEQNIKYCEEIERLNKSLEEQRHFYLEQLQQKENIIKEVREYIKMHIRKDDEYPDYMEMLKYEYKELLEILDKENK